MNITELDSYNLKDAVRFHTRLNPKLWGRDEHLLPEVREALLRIADDFREFLGVKDIEVQDITISGSNAAYSYTPFSDIDLHLVVNIPESEDEVYQELFNAKKYQYNDQHSIRVRDSDVELYVQPSDQPVISQGVYSLIQNSWLDVPKRKRANIDDNSVRDKYEDLAIRIQNAVKGGDKAAINELISKIKRMRQSGLEDKGEFGPENLAFKMLRNHNLIKKLYDARDRAHAHELSLKERDPNIKENITYSHGNNNIIKDIEDFYQNTCKDIALENPPKLQIHQDAEWSKKNHSFGRYDPDSGSMHVAIHGRHLIDILRTLAHELVHAKQDEENRLNPDSGETGSPEENEANAIAGQIMRDFAEHSPEAFEHGIDEQAPATTKAVYTQAQFDAWATQYAQQYGVPLDLVNHVMRKETGWMGDPNKAAVARSPAGAKGVMQLMPITAKSVGVTNVFNPQENIRGGIAYLSQLLQRYKNPTTTLAAYNWGPTNVDKWQATNPSFQTLPIETQKYISDYAPAARVVPATPAQPAPPRWKTWLGISENASGYIPSNAERNDPRYKTALTVDVKPDTLKKNAAKLGSKIARDGRPPLLREDEELFEVKMSPGALRQWAETNEAEGILVGFEAEMIFPNISEDNEFESEPDYDADESVAGIRQWRGDIYNFFVGDHNTRRTVDNAIREIESDYEEFVDETWQEYFDENFDEYRTQVAELAEVDEDDDEAMQDAYDTHGDAVADEMRAEYRDSNETWENFLENGDIAYMSGVANRYDLEWPVWTEDDRSPGLEIDELGRDLQRVIGMPVRTSDRYHGVSRRPGIWIIEPDGSLDTEDFNEAGLEVISPPQPIEKTLSDLRRLLKWAKRDHGAYTNGSTGFHINVSVPFKETASIDYLKLIAFMGDKYVLDEFDRRANTYCRSVLDKVLSNLEANPNKIDRIMTLMKANLVELAHREIADSIGEEKYSSAHKHKKYIEFRSPGGNYLNDDYDQSVRNLTTTTLRLARAMQIAASPSAEREEYAKKLSKMMSFGNRGYLQSFKGGRKQYTFDTDSEFAKLFTLYSSGLINPEQLKKRWATAVLAQDRKSNQGKQWEIYNSDTLETLQKLGPSSYDEALEQMLAYAKENGINELYLGVRLTDPNEISQGRKQLARKFLNPQAADTSEIAVGDRPYWTFIVHDTVNDTDTTLKLYAPHVSDTDRSGAIAALRRDLADKGTRPEVIDGLEFIRIVPPHVRPAGASDGEVKRYTARLITPGYPQSRLQHHFNTPDVGGDYAQAIAALRRDLRRAGYSEEQVDNFVVDTIETSDGTILSPRGRIGGEQSLDANYEIYNVASNQPVFRFISNTDWEARRKFEDWIASGNLNRAGYGWRRIEGRGIPGSTAELQRQRSGSQEYIVDYTMSRDGEIRNNRLQVNAVNADAAMAQVRSYLEQGGYEVLRIEAEEIS